MQKAIYKLSPYMQTSGIEGFHSLINQFAPKMVAFSYEGMTCRLYLSALHYNENAGRVQAKSKDGKLQYGIQYPRAKSGGHTVVKVLQGETFNYADQVTVLALENCSGGDKTLRQRTPILAKKPLPVCSKYQKPTKEDAISNLTSRFNTNN
ncbi:uncharacterized protein [Asterias amurensis]